MIDLDWIRELVELVDGSEIDSLEISRFGTTVKVRKSPPGGAGGQGAVPVLSGGGAPGGPAGGAPPTAAGAGPAAEEAAGGPAEAEAAEEAGEDLHEIESPMVGTFYRAPAPDAPPYVEVGDRVEEGETLCILEAMKLMNELESEVSGTIREICVENAESVEYGQVLFRVDTG